MFLSLRELELKRIPFELQIPPGRIEFADELTQVTPIAVKGAAELVSDVLGEIRVSGKLRVTMEAACDRCVEPATLPMETDFDLIYRPDESGEPVGEVHVSEGESEIGFYSGDGLELDDILLEQIVLALPMQKVCSAGCKGICPSCGQNRNLTSCGCESKPAVESQWASALQSLKK